MDTSKELHNFCANVFYLRKKYHLSEESMAMLIDISEEDLRLVESGDLPDSVTVDTLFRLYKVFDIPTDAFF